MALAGLILSYIVFVLSALMIAGAVYLYSTGQLDGIMEQIMQNQEMMNQETTNPVPQPGAPE